MKGSFIGLILVLATSAVHAEDYDGLPDRFFEKVAAHQYIDAGRALGIPEDIADDKQLEKIVSSLKGDYKYHELIFTQNIGTRVVNLAYIVGMKEKPGGVIIRMYKPESAWKVTGIAVYENYRVLARENPPTKLTLTKNKSFE